MAGFSMMKPRDWLRTVPDSHCFIEHFGGYIAPLKIRRKPHGLKGAQKATCAASEVQEFPGCVVTGDLPAQKVDQPACLAIEKHLRARTNKPFERVIEPRAVAGRVGIKLGAFLMRIVHSCCSAELIS